MKQTILLLAILVLSINDLSAQRYANKNLVNLKKIELGTHGIGLSYEIVQSESTTIDVAVGRRTVSV